MAKYDFTFLLDDEAEEKNLKEFLKTFSGTITEEKNWGKKSLAYPIQKKMSATFYNWQIEMKEKDVTEMKKKLGYNDKIMRYLILKVD